MPSIRRFVTSLFLLCSLSAAAGVQCIGSVAQMQAAATAEASIASGTSEFRIKNGVLLSVEFLFQTATSGSNRRFVVEGGWNSACTAKVAAGRSTLADGISFRNAHPHYITSSHLLLRDLRIVGPIRITTGDGERTIDRCRVESTDAHYVDLRGTAVTMTRSQFVGGEIFITSLGNGAQSTVVLGNEFREVRAFRVETHTLGAVSIRSNTIVPRNPLGWAMPVGNSTIEVLTYGEPTIVEVSHNLVTRSSTYDLFGSVFFSGAIHLDMDNNGTSPPLILEENWFYARNNMVTGSPEFQAALAEATNRNVAGEFAAPFSTLDAHLVPDAKHALANYGTPRIEDLSAVDLRGERRVIGMRIDIGANESDALWHSSFE